MALGRAIQARQPQTPSLVCAGGFGTIPRRGQRRLIAATRSRAAISNAERIGERGARNMSDRRELYRSPNGDTWFLGREPANGHAFIVHQPNAPSGGRLSHIELGAFLRDAAGPEQQALLRLIGTLVEVPPYAERT